MNETWLEILAICDKGEALLSTHGTYGTVSYMRLYGVLRTVLLSNDDSYIGMFYLYQVTLSRGRPKKCQREAKT